MGLWDNIKDWFTKDEEYQFDEEKKAREEKEMMDKLLQLDRELYDADEKARNDAEIASKPVEQEFEIIDVDKTTDEEIAKAANDKYAKEQADKKKELEDSYNTNQGKQEEKLTDTQESAELKQDKLLQAKAEQEEKVKNNAIESGLLDSSIATTQKEQVGELTQAALDNLSADTKKQLERISGEMEYLTAMKDQALVKHDEKMTAKINGEIDALTLSRDKLIDRQTKQNEETEFNRKKYDKSVLAAAEKFKDSWEEKMQKRYRQEAESGYADERAVNYDERLKIATDYYSQYPKDIAMQLIEKNPQMKKFLGNNLYKLRHVVNQNGK